METYDAQPRGWDEGSDLLSSLREGSLGEKRDVALAHNVEVY